MTWVPRVVVVVVGALVLFNAQCRAMCAVQPCQPITAKQHASQHSSSPYHQQRDENEKEEPASCSHESVTSDGAKKVPTGETSLASVAELLPYDGLFSSFSGTRCRCSRLELSSHTAVPFRTVLRI